MTLIYQTLLVSGTEPPVIDTCPDVHESCITNSTCLRIAAWNIKVFGNSKISNQPVVDIILQVIYQYDLIIIQELKDADCEDQQSENCVFKQLTDQIEIANPGKYGFGLSTRLSSSGSAQKELYGYVWNSEKISNAGFHQVVDPNIERPPYIGLFESNGVKFQTLPLHSKPDFAYEETDKLDDVWYEFINHNVADLNLPENDQNPIALGDFNFDSTYVSGCNMGTTCESNALPGWVWHVNHKEDTTVAVGTDQAYDRIVSKFSNSFPGTASCGRAFIYDHLLDDILQPDEVSDHYPVEFVINF